MAELKDYSGKFIPDLKYTDFSKEFMAQLLTEYARLYVMADGVWYSLVQERYGPKVPSDIDYDVWVNKLPVYETRGILKVLNLKTNTVADWMKVLQLIPGFSYNLFPHEIDIKNENHAVVTVRDCPALIRFEKREPEKIVHICQELELPSAIAYVKQFNPDIEVTMPIMPPRKSPKDICCRFEFKLKPKKK